MAKAQVNGPGPSDSALFDIVIDLPGDPNIGSDESIGGVTDQTTQLNVRDGGNVGGVFDAFFGSEVNISGGTVVNFFGAFSGSEVNISGGTVGNNFDANSGSEVTISGGTVGVNFDAESGSDVELIGGEFLLNGDAFTGPSIILSDSDVFTGTLQDGSAFVFSFQVGDDLSGVTLTVAALPTFDTTPRVVNTDISAEQRSGLRAGQSLTLLDGGVLGENFAAIDATLSIEGGGVGNGLETAGSTVNISGGTVGSFRAFSGSEVNFSGGTVGTDFFNTISGAFSGSVVNISGGTVGIRFFALPGSEVNISGGTCLLYTSPSPRDQRGSRMPSSA